MSTYTNEDCMSVMARYPDKYFDIAIVDPPYGIGDWSTKTYHNGSNKRKYKTAIWNKSIPNNLYFEMLFKKTKNQIIWGANYFNCFNLKGGAIVWDKGARAKTLSRFEIASVSFRRMVDGVFIYLESGFLDCDTRIHPCQKPVSLYSWIAKKYCKPGWKVLDTHVGSASSLIAYEEAGIEYVGCELDESYYKASSKRLGIFKNQARMF